MFKTIKNALKTPDIRKKLWYTLLLITLFRLGCYITVPGVDISALNNLMNDSSSSLAGMINLISGGAFAKFSIFFGKVTLKHGFTYIISSALSFYNTTLTTIFSFVVTVDHLSLFIAIPIF